MRARVIYRLSAGVLVALAATGCVERTVRINTAPQGALVIVNDEEVGVSPVRFSFLWYGDYDIILRKPGYETLKTHHRIDPPWYQVPPFDFVAETMILTTIHDEHVLPTYALRPLEGTTLQEIVTRAAELRERTLLTD